MFEAYILPVLIFAVIGIAAGVLLTVASSVFAVESDPRVDEVNEALPQINCGACGFSGCADYAAAIVNDGERINLCKPGGAKSADAISAIMGVEAGNTQSLAAVVACAGGCGEKKRDFDFHGVSSCRSAKRFYGGMWGCKYGCIGLGDCAEVCPAGAIEINDGLARVIPEKCIGCGLCEKECPNAIISLKRADARAAVLCSSRAFGKEVKAVCSSGCIGCRICEKQCEYGAVKVDNNLAVIDPDKCTGCGKCAEKCPVRVITVRGN